MCDAVIYHRVARNEKEMSDVHSDASDGNNGVSDFEQTLSVKNKLLKMASTLPHRIQ